MTRQYAFAPRILYASWVKIHLAFLAMPGRGPQGRIPLSPSSTALGHFESSNVGRVHLFPFFSFGVKLYVHRHVLLVTIDGPKDPMTPIFASAPPSTSTAYTFVLGLTR